MLEKYSIRDFHVIDKVTAKNKKGEPRFNNPVWPGYNSSDLMQVSEEDKVKNVILSIREHNKSAINNDELITVCTWKLEDYFYD